MLQRDDGSYMTLRRVTPLPPQKDQAVLDHPVLCPLVRGHLFSLSRFRPGASEPVTPMTTDGQGTAKTGFAAIRVFDSFGLIMVG